MDENGEYVEVSFCYFSHIRSSCEDFRFASLFLSNVIMNHIDRQKATAKIKGLNLTYAYILLKPMFFSHLAGILVNQEAPAFSISIGTLQPCRGPRIEFGKMI